VPPRGGWPAPGSMARWGSISASTFAQVGGVEQVGGAHLGHEALVGHPAVGVGKGQLDGLDLQVGAFHAVGPEAADVELLQHAQRHERGNALAIGRQLVHRVAGKAGVDGVDPLHLMGRQIGRADLRAVLAREGVDGLCHLAAVEGLALGRGNQRATHDRQPGRQNARPPRARARAAGRPGRSPAA